jgi:phospholipid-binding lipoprotein MlaA
MSFFRGITSVCFIVLFMITLLVTRAAFASDAEKEVEISDPLEPMNRAIYGFNSTLDKYMLEPAAKTYKFVVPKPGRQAVRNILSNLSEPVTLLNSALQGNTEGSFTSFWRFTLNSTFGICGIFDIASVAGLKANKEDFGQTIGYYGLGSGPYLMLPILGPSNGRDLVGSVVDSVSDPYNYLVDDEGIWAKNILEGLDKRASILDLMSEINRTSFDPYATIRSLYTQKRYDEIKSRK